MVFLTFIWSEMNMNSDLGESPRCVIMRIETSGCLTPLRT